MRRFFSFIKSFIRKKHFLPLTAQFIAAIVIFTIATAGIVFFNIRDYRRLQDILLRQSLDSYSAQLARATTDAYESYENICYSVAYSPIVHSYLTSGSAEDSYYYYEQLEAQLSSTAMLSPYIVDIAVYGSDGSFAALTGSRSNYEEFTASLAHSRFAYQSVGTADVHQTLCHVLAMPIYSLGTGNSRYLGILFLAVDPGSLLGSSLQNHTADAVPSILFADSEGALLYGDTSLYQSLLSLTPETREQSSFSLYDREADTEYLVSRSAISPISHTLYILLDKGSVTAQVGQIASHLLLSVGVMVALLLLFLFVSYHPLVNSLHQLTGIMKEISTGDRRAVKDGVSIRQGLIGSTEIRDIARAFEEMLTETDRLNHTIFDTYTRMYEIEASNRKTEIAFLRSQINPHFLYNTLTMICGMAAEGMTDKIISVTGALSSFFRYSIKGSDLVPLREEMEIVRSYLMIQEERFEGRFSTRYEFSEDSWDCLIPRMIIQPLVENAIVHGLENSLKPHGELLIGAGRNPVHGYLAIWVFDNGVGMPPDKLESLRASVAAASENTKEGDAAGHLAALDAKHHDSIGILNVNSRMVLYYGNDYTIIIDSEEGVGTNFQLRIPYQTRKEEQDHV
ncbi:MAG: histidine kinase [Eubacteriales bacterium]|nr:histidine kinase [Eubacteriales bacterium]